MSDPQETREDADQIGLKDNEIQSQAGIQKEQKSISEDLHRIIIRYLTVEALSDEGKKSECSKLLLYFLKQLYPAKVGKHYRKNDAAKQSPVGEKEAFVEELTRLQAKDNDGFQREILAFSLEELHKDLENHSDLKNELSESTVFSKDAKEKLLSTIAIDLEQLNIKVQCLKQSIKTLRLTETRKTIPDLKTTLYDTKIQPTFIKLLENNAVCQRFLELFIIKFSVINEPTLPELNTPLHYAVRTRNTTFIEWILDQTGVDVNRRNKQRKTALFTLCEDFDNAMKANKNGQTIPIEVETIKSIILLLLENGADFNICGDHLRLPFELLKRHGAIEATFLKTCRDIFKHAIVEVSKQRKLEYNQEGKVEIRITVTLLEIFLRFRHDKEFKTMFDRLKVDHHNVQSVIKNLLHVAVDLDLNETVKLIINKAGSNIFAEKKRTMQLANRVEMKSLLKKVCEHGQLASLRLLLEKMNDRDLINDDPILVIALTKANALAKDSDAQLKVLECAKLLAANPNIHLSKADNFGNTALHVALKFGFTDIALQLAKQSFAFLGVRNSRSLTPLSYASHDFCKQYFDECIETDKNRRYREEIRLNLNGLNPYFVKKERTTDNKQWKEHEKFPPLGRSNKPRFDTEMDVVKQMAKSKELKPLLLHPVIYTFILIKWMRLSLWCYANITVTILTTVSFGIYSVQKIAFGDECTLLRILSLFGLFYIVLRELLRLWMLRRNYNFRIENLFDYCIVITGTVSILLDPEPVYCSLTVILFAVQIIRLVGFLPFNSISIYMHMFQTVAQNFFKSLLLFCPLLFAFVYSFFLCYNNFSDPISANATQEERFNSFGSVVNAAVKTLVMTIGEFDASESEIVGGRTVIFVLFIFFAPIVVLNLINGLAVSDITAIRNESELISISKKVFILARYESCLRNLPRSTHWMFPTPFFKHYSFMIKIRPEEGRKIFVQPKITKKLSGATNTDTVNENIPSQTVNPGNQPFGQQNRDSEIPHQNPEEIPLFTRNSHQDTAIQIVPYEEASHRRTNATNTETNENEFVEQLHRNSTLSVKSQQSPEDTSVPLSEMPERNPPPKKKQKNKKSSSEDFWQSVPKLKLDCLVFSGETPEKCLKSVQQSTLLRPLKLFLMASLDETFKEDMCSIADRNIKHEKSKAVGRKRVEGKPIGETAKTTN